MPGCRCALQRAACVLHVMHACVDALFVWRVIIYSPISNIGIMVQCVEMKLTASALCFVYECPAKCLLSSLNNRIKTCKLRYISLVLSRAQSHFDVTTCHYAPR